MATTNNAAKKQEQAVVEQPQEQQTAIETKQPQEQQQPMVVTQSVPQAVEQQSVQQQEVQQPVIAEQSVPQITEQPVVVEQPMQPTTTPKVDVGTTPSPTTIEPLQTQPSNDTPTPNVNVEANKNAAAKSVYDFYRKSGQISRYNGVDYVIQNGKAVPLFKDVDTILGIDGKYHTFDADGNLSNDEYVSQYNFTPGGEELLNNAFDYFDAHNGDTKSIYNTDFLKTEGGTGNMYDLATSFDINTRKWGWKNTLLERIKEEYNKRNSSTTEAQNLFDNANMPVVADPVVNKDSNGNDDVISPEEANEFFKRCKKFHTTQRDNPAMYSLRQQYVKDFQKYMQEFMDKHPSVKERVQNGINWRGKDGKEYFPIDGNYGQNTTSVMWHMLDMVGGEDAVEAFGGQYNPTTDSYEPLDDNDAAREYYEGLGLTTDERHEKKRLERVQNLQNFSNLLSGVGDTISASQGVQVKDKTADISQETELLEKKKIDNENQYKARMDELKKRFDDARTEKQKQMIAIAMEREKMKNEAEQNRLNREFQAAENERELAFKASEGAKERASNERMNTERGVVDIETAKIAAGAKTNQNTRKVMLFGGREIYSSKNDNDQVFYANASALAKNKSSLLPQGLSMPDEIDKILNRIADSDGDFKVIKEYGKIDEELDKIQSNGGEFNVGRDKKKWSNETINKVRQHIYNKLNEAAGNSGSSWSTEDM